MAGKAAQLAEPKTFFAAKERKNTPRRRRESSARL
jgi:hypothetical protein